MLGRQHCHPAPRAWMSPFPAACHLFSFPSSPEPEATVRAQSFHREDRTGERGYLCMSTAPGRLLKRVYGVLTRGLACTRSPLSACLPARLPSRLPFLPQASSVPDALVSWLFPQLSSLWPWPAFARASAWTPFPQMSPWLPLSYSMSALSEVP